MVFRKSFGKGQRTRFFNAFTFLLMAANEGVALLPHFELSPDLHLLILRVLLSVVLFGNIFLREITTTPPGRGE